MNKQQRDYAISRIEKIRNGKTIKCECEKPSLYAHIRRAIARGEAKMKPAKDITAKLEAKIVKGEERYEIKQDLQDLFEAPKSYHEAMAELQAEQAKHEEENSRTHKFAQALIDKIELGQFENGEEPIRQMEAYEPKPPKAGKKKAA